MSVRSWCVLIIAAMCALCPTRAVAQDVVEYYGVDAIGSVRVVFDSAGTVTSRMDYGPFGEQLSPSTVGAKSYAQLFRDGEVGQDYAEARMYQFRTGRFNTVDPVFSGLFNPQLWNRYSYAGNNPLSFVDPTGLKLRCNSDGICTDDPTNPDPPDLPRRPKPGPETGCSPLPSVAGSEGDCGGEEPPEGGPPQNPNPNPNPNPKPVSRPAPIKCTGPAPGCRPVSFAPGMPPLYANDEEWNYILRNQAASIAFVAGWELAPLVPTGAELSALLFARHGVGWLNSNDYIRIGMSWDGPATSGREVFRIAIGSKRTTGVTIHWTLW